MTPAEDAANRAAADSSPGYACYPRITPVGNPDWWTRDTNHRPPAQDAVERPPAPVPTPEPAQPITPTVEPTKPREPAEIGMVRHWITQPAPTPPPRKWWHRFTQPKEKSSQ